MFQRQPLRLIEDDEALTLSDETPSPKQPLGHGEPWKPVKIPNRAKLKLPPKANTGLKQTESMGLAAAAAPSGGDDEKSWEKGKHKWTTPSKPYGPKPGKPYPPKPSSQNPRHGS